MKNWEAMIGKTTFRYIDDTGRKHFNNEHYTALTSFAIDDALTLSASNKLSPPTMRLWSHPKTIVLGIPDARLPFIEKGVKILAEHGYHVIVRNSGGLAVALDEGVLNMSLILPDAKGISIHDSYDLMFNLIKAMLSYLTNHIKAYEIEGSYCPGDYDLSINGVKFAGISQRRIRNGAAIQIYIDVNGNSKKRANLIKRFYEASLGSEETSFTYPTIKPNVMGSLSELLNKNISVEEIKDSAFKTLDELNKQVIASSLAEEEMITFKKRYQQMIKRNKDIARLQKDDK